MRTVICHYHIFKNSGTSFDEQLTANYGDAHCIFDGPFRYSKINQDELIKIVSNHKDCIAFSSHQINLPVPSSIDVRVEPVVFVRHPLLRIRSIYQFSKKSPATSFVGEFSSGLDFGDWINECIKSKAGLTMISNAQTRLLSNVYNRPSIQRRSASGGLICDFNQAVRNLSQVNLLGRTEFFELDVSKFTKIMAEFGVEFEFHRKSASNVTSGDLELPVEARLERMQREVGEPVYALLKAMNQQDLNLYDFVTETLQY
ncbi:hypothetical protein FV139_16520 [Parahaliea maris]|uniref:Sulfotransferase family protein n=1 Tax=Parahaliea maris TaxID=2716870 RepID=A0A5C8ZSF5_9GAMM|nr:sulfotransferase family 2 domain-containing protein [Parahaliea maris]TXS91335.1 hypothetical protein FV139_16520 [Parahaliea maris]